MYLSSSTALVLSVVFAGLTTLPAVSAQCKWGVIPRKEFRTMQYAEQYYYFQAVRKLMERPNERTYSIYDIFTSIHARNNRYIHGVAMFFPWHRMFLWYFEKYIESVYNYPLRIPYWNWQYDSQSPELAPLFTPQAFGNQVDSNGCVSNGWFLDWKPLYPTLHCLQRTKNRVMTAFHSAEIINSILTSAKNYDELRRNIEPAPHGRVHNSIGGDMLQMHSPNDPLFYSHHANVDKMWAQWQALDPANNFWSYVGVTDTGATASLTDTFVSLPAGYKVGHVMDTTKLCYYYADMEAVADTPAPAAAAALVRRDAEEENHFADLVRRAEAAPQKVGDVEFQKISSRLSAKQSETEFLVVNGTDRTQLTLTRNVEPIDGDWLRMNGQMELLVRISEETYNSQINTLNTLDGFVPKSSLINRQDTLRLLAPKVDKFEVNVKDTLVQFQFQKGDKRDDASIKKVLQTIQASVNETVQTPPANVAEALVAVIGPPVGSKKSACNPLSDKHGNGIGKEDLAASGLATASKA